MFFHLDDDDEDAERGDYEGCYDQDYVPRHALASTLVVWLCSSGGISDTGGSSLLELGLALGLLRFCVSEGMVAMGRISVWCSC